MTWHRKPTEEEPYKTLEERYRTIREEHGGWFVIEYGSDAQADALRRYAQSEGYTDLRDFQAKMLEENWDYYDVIRIAYGR